MRWALSLLAAATLSGTTVDQGSPGTLPWPVTPTSIVYPDGGSSAPANVNPAAMTNGHIAQVLCACVPTLVDGNPRRSILILDPPGGPAVWIGTSAAMSVPVSALPLTAGAAITHDAASVITYYCQDLAVCLPDAGGVEADGGGIYYSEVL